jgi:uncharacterized membrane protein YtjA (UPF0391 family)
MAIPPGEVTQERCPGESPKPRAQSPEPKARSPEPKAHPEAQKLLLPGREGTPMLKGALIFLVIGLVAALFGFTTIAGASFAIAKVLAGIFLFRDLAAVSKSLKLKTRI